MLGLDLGKIAPLDLDYETCFFERLRCARNYQTAQRSLVVDDKEVVILISVSCAHCRNHCRERYQN